MDTQPKTEIERACCLAHFRSIERPWMCISVDWPLWEGSKPVSIPGGAWTSLRSCPIPKAMPTETPSPWRIESLLVSLTMEKRARHAGEWGSWGGCPCQGINLPDEGRDFGRARKDGIGNHDRDAELCACNRLFDISRNRFHETLELIVTFGGERLNFNERIGYARIHPSKRAVVRSCC